MTDSQPESSHDLQLATDDPRIGDVRVFLRLMIYLGNRKQGIFIQDVLKRPFHYMPNYDSFATAADEHTLRVAGRWSLKIGLRIPEHLHTHTVKDHRGRDLIVTTLYMSGLPGYFDEFDHLRPRKKFNQNSDEMGTFYLLRYGEVYYAELHGRGQDFQEKFEEDLTMIRMVHGDKLIELDT